MGQSIGTSDTLVSANGNFELGFFKKNTTYVGIWFKKVPKDNIVWVADTHFRYDLDPDSHYILTIGDDGNLYILTIGEDGNLTFDYQRSLFSATNFSNIGSTHALLSDSGNLLLVNNSNLNILWQSFDHPTDTLLPEMKIGVDRDSGRSWSLRSWTSAEDPSPGYFTLELDQYDRKLNIKGMSGTYSIATELFSFTIQGFSPTITAMWQGAYTSRLVLSASGELNQQIWSEDNKQWVSLQSSKCRLCGDFGICTPQANEPCECLKGLEPDAENSWKEGSMSAGCVRKTPLLCSNTSNNGLANGYFALDRVNYLSTGSLVFAAQKAST